MSKQKDTNHMLKAKKHCLPIIFILIFWIAYVQSICTSRQITGTATMPK
jgi:hypothetical protein